VVAGATTIEQEGWGVLRNVGKDLDVPKTKSKGGHHKWEPAMLTRYEKVHKDNPMALAAYAIARYLGNRLGDVALLRWDALRIEHDVIDGDVVEEWTFNFNQNKGGQEMWLPVPEELKTFLLAPALVESRPQGWPHHLERMGRGVHHRLARQQVL